MKCFYHANCPDGIGAAWAAWKANPGAEFIPIGYETVLRMESLEGQDVLSVDFAFKPEVATELCKIAKSLTMIDHHPPTIANLKAYEALKCNGQPVQVIASDKRSGAYLTWTHFFPHKAVPEILRYVDDRDRWVWELEYSREISAWLNTKSWERPELFDAYAEELFGHPGDCLKVGKATLAYMDKQVEKICLNAVPCTLTGKAFSQSGWSVQSSVLISEVGHYLLEKKPCDMAVIWYEGKEKTHVSLRSKKNGVDVNLIAKEFGGGGHVSAAGFAINNEDFIDAFGLKLLTAANVQEDLLEYYTKHPIHTKQALSLLKWLMDSTKEAHLVDTPYLPPEWPNKPRA